MKKVLIITRSSEFSPEKSTVISKAIQTVHDKPIYHPVSLNAFLKVMDEIDIYGVKLDRKDIRTVEQFYSEIQKQYVSTIEEWKNIYFSRPEMSKIKFLRNRNLWNIVTSVGEMRRQLLTDLQDFLYVKIAEKNKKKWLEINNIYVTFEYKSAKEKLQVTLVLWDQLSKEVEFVEKDYRLGLMKAICNDCQIDENRDGNILYIHDKQWGLLDKQVELFNQLKDREVGWDDKIITKEELSALKKYFSYASCFQHIGGEGSLFNNICQLNFGSDFVGRVCDEAERMQIDIFEAKKYLDKQTADGFKK